MEHNTIVNIGVQRFDRIREQKAFYIDKTAFIKEWWESGCDVTLITRPRRFGKTLNMSMLECFFSCKYADRGDLFEGLSIWEEKSLAGDYTYRKLQGTFPVIFLSFANIKAGMGDEVAAGTINAMANFVQRYYGKDVIIILDEYDTPMQEAWLSGY